jgi:hypothetical protein
MITTWRGVAAVLAVGLAASAGGADEAKKEGAKSDPPGVPVEAVLKANKATYPLQLGGKTAAEFRKLIEAGGDTGNYPEAPAVDLVLELKNTGTENIQIKVGGTQNVVELDLKGPGAVTVPLRRRITPKFIIAPRVMMLEPGKSVTVPINSLAFGSKGSHRAYWVEPGRYTLSASYKTWVSPKPRGAQDAGGGFGAVTLTSAPVALQVEAK